MKLSAKLNQRTSYLRDDYKTKRNAALIEWQEIAAATTSLPISKLRRVRIHVTALKAA